MRKEAMKKFMIFIAMVFFVMSVLASNDKSDMPQIIVTWAVGSTKVSKKAIIQSLHEIEFEDVNQQAHFVDTLISMQKSNRDCTLAEMVWWLRIKISRSTDNYRCAVTNSGDNALRTHEEFREKESKFLKTLFSHSPSVLEQIGIYEQRGRDIDVLDALGSTVHIEEPSEVDAKNS